MTGTAHEAAQDSDAGGLGPWLPPLAVVLLGTFMVLLDTTIVTVAVPAIRSELGASSDQVQWVVTVYNLALGVVVPLAGWMGDRYGLGRVYVASLLAFAATSILCGLAWSLGSLVAFRALQAVGGGLLGPISLAIVYQMAPRRRIGLAMGLYGLGAVAAPAVGPTLGGYLVQYVSWRLIFFINLPVGILGALAALALLPRFSTRPGQRFDLPGFATASAGLFALLLAISEGQAWGWTSEAILLLLAVSALALAAFVAIELSVDEPMVDLRVFRHWPFTNSLLVIALLVAGLFASFFYVPVYLQEVRGIGPLESGIALIPAALVTAAMMPLAGRVYDRVGARLPAAVGLAITAFGMYLFHGLTTRTPTSDVVLWMAVRSLGGGLATMPIVTSGLSAVPADQVSRASSINNIVQRVAASLGLAGLTAVLVGHQAGPASHAALTAVQRQSFTGALSEAFLIVAVMTALAVPLALLLPPHCAAREGGGRSSR